MNLKSNTFSGIKCWAMSRHRSASWRKSWSASLSNSELRSWIMPTPKTDSVSWGKSWPRSGNWIRDI